MEWPGLDVDYSPLSSSEVKNEWGLHLCSLGRDGSVGILTLRAGRSGDRIPLGGARLSTSVQTGSPAHSAFFRMGYGSFPGVKRPGRDINHQPLSSAWVKEKVELYLLPLCALLFAFNLTTMSIVNQGNVNQYQG